MLGVDIYDRYQDVTDWTALARAARWAWIKGTDGGGRAPVRADAFVREALRVGMPVGLYHYAQLAPSPEAQADVLAAEVRRLGADQVAPALDIEDPFVPGSAARAFAERFCRRLRTHVPRVAVYGNTTMLAAIRPDLWDIDGLVIWAADYGVNDGRRNPDLRPYTGRVDVHQYTSAGRVAGVPGLVDLNHAHTTRHLLTEEDDDMLTAKEIAQIADAVWTQQVTNVEQRKSGKGAAWAQDKLSYIDQGVWVLRAEVAGMRASQDKLVDLVADGSGADAASIKAAIREAIRENVLKVEVAIRNLVEAQEQEATD